MFEPREDWILDSPPPIRGRAPAGMSRRAVGVAVPWMQALLAALRSRHLAWALTLAGAMAVMALHVFYAVVIQGWGAPLP